MSELENQTQEIDTQEVPAVAEAQEVPSVEQAPAPVEQTRPEKAPPPKWAIDEITSERARRRQAEQEARDMREMLERLQRQQQQPKEGQQEQQPPKVQYEQQPSREAFQSEVRAEAARMKLAEDSGYILNQGRAANPNFNETLGILNAVGFTTDEVVSDLIAVDKANAHKILEKIAKDPEQAVAYAKMDSRSRVAAFTRMAMTEQPAARQTEQPKPISKAPPPKPGFDPAGGAGDPNDLMDDTISDAEWARRYKAKRKA